MTWSIKQVQPTLKMKLSYRDWWDWVQPVTKIKQDNDVINRIGVVYSKIETKLSGPIWLGLVYDEN